MSGFYVRIERAGRWVNVDLVQLSDDELAKFFEGRDDGARWAIALAKWIRDNVKPLSIPRGLE